MRIPLRFPFLFGLMLLALAFGWPAFAGSPAGNDWFQLLASPATGNDNTGDGGTGNPADYNYYYVGQSFTGTMQINVSSPSGSNASNIWVDFSTTTVSSTGLASGTFFPNWASQSIDSSLGRIYSTGYRTTGYATGLGNFGTVNFSFKRPTAANYGTGAAGTLDINTGVIGNTTESNISFDGSDILDDAEDFRFHVWADTKKPFAEDNSPASGTTGVLIDSDYRFRLFDTKLGEGFSTNTAFGAGGVGTGVNTATPPGSVVFAPSHFAATSYDAYACSGIWGTNACGVTIDPPSPSGMAGDSRNWQYATLYSVTVGGYRDLASPNQDQLGDANGPNTMDQKVFTFTTEADTVKPLVVGELPTRGSGGNSASTNITVYVEDRKTYPNGPSGVGIDPATCRFNISSPSFALTTFSQGQPTVTVATSTPSGYVAPYGYAFTINPATDFAENETVSVSAYDCADTAGNVMVTDNWTFTTADNQPPYVTTTVPSNDQIVAPTGTIALHIKDDGVGVSLSNTVIYVNGVYYTNTGGAGSVTTNGTRITFASSQNYNGGNYAGDTTSRSGTANDYAFVIDPQADFADNEAVTVIVYAADSSGNIMERVVYALPVSSSGSLSCGAGSSYCGAGTSWNGSSCIASGGSGFCGTNTSWNGTSCVSTGGGSGSCPSTGGGGSSSSNLQINVTTVSVVQIDASSVLVSWTSNMPGTARVVYGDQPTSNIGLRPNYGYQSSTPQYEDNALYHSVVVSGLRNGILYHFRPLTISNGHEVYGTEVRMAPVFSLTQVAPEGMRCESTATVPATSPTVPAPVRPNRLTAPPTPGRATARPAVPTAPSKLKILNIEKRGSNYYFTGQSMPGSALKLFVY